MVEIIPKIARENYFSIKCITINFYCKIYIEKDLYSKNAWKRIFTIKWISNDFYYKNTSEINFTIKKGIGNHIYYRNLNLFLLWICIRNNFLIKSALANNFYSKMYWKWFL